LAAEYLATLLDDTYQVEVIATATDGETGLQLGFTACGCATDSELKSQLRARAPLGWRQCLNYKTLKGRQRLNRVGLAKRKIGVRLDSIAVTVTAVSDRSPCCAYGPADVAPAWTTVTAIGTKKGRSLKK
jgi:hypothetical protein